MTTVISPSGYWRIQVWQDPDGTWTAQGATTVPSCMMNGGAFVRHGHTTEQEAWNAAEHVLGPLRQQAELDL